MANLVSKLQVIQQKLKAPKGLTNKFGGYNYRSLESIMEAVKPLLAEVGAYIIISDEMVVLGDRYYVKAMATIADDTNSITTHAYAREALGRKGMDDSQLTGATSSYARKYAMNGLLAIDDTQDADSQAPAEVEVKSRPPVKPVVSNQLPRMDKVPMNPKASEGTKERCWRYIWNKAEQLRDTMPNSGDIITSMDDLDTLILEKLGKYPSNKEESEKIVAEINDTIFRDKNDCPF